MKKVFPSSRPTKRFSRRTTDIISALVLIITITVLTTCAFLSEKNYDSTSQASGFAIYKGNTSEEKAALMFNVYENTKNVNAILEILRKYSAKATFFIGGIWAEKNADTLLKIIMEGHELGCHGYLHKDHSQMSVQANKEEIAMCCNLIRSITGVTVTLFAPPSGSYNEQTERACKSLGMKLVMWTKDTIDWRDSDVDLLVKRAVKNISKGDLILMHPKDQTLLALPTIIENYKNSNLQLVTVSDVLN